MTGTNGTRITNRGRGTCRASPDLDPNFHSRPCGVRRAWASLMIAILVVALASCGRQQSSSDEEGPGEERGAAVVAEVVDGDTVRVRIAGTEERVRLIGVDTPETHGRGGLRECFGAEATARTAALIPPGTDVRLVRDVEARDRYGRLLAYVFRRRDRLFVNLALAREGYAAAFTYPPNVAHADELRVAAGQARDAGRGLWGRCGGPDTVLS